MSLPKPRAAPTKGTHADFSRLYADDPALTSLDLAGALAAGDTALSTISDALNCSTRLRHLDLSDNGITDVGAALLAGALGSATAATGLETIVLDGNRIGTAGVNALVAALRRTPKTLFVSLQRNKADVDAAAMYHLQTMVRLNDQPGRLRQAILDIIAENEAMQRGGASSAAMLAPTAGATVATVEGGGGRGGRTRQNEGGGGDGVAGVAIAAGVNGAASGALAGTTGSAVQSATAARAGSGHPPHRARLTELDLSDAYSRWPPPSHVQLSSSSSSTSTARERPATSSSKRDARRQGGAAVAFVQEQEDDDEVDDDAVMNTSNPGSTPQKAADDDARAVAPAPRRPTTLVLLFHQFLEILCFVVEDNVTLRKLDLSSNLIGDEGAATIAAMLRRNRHLDELVLDSNSVTDSGAALLVAAFESNNTLQVMSVIRNLLTPECVFEVEAAQALNRQPLLLKRWFYELRRNSAEAPAALDFDSKGSEQRFDDVGVRLMCVALRHNTHVQSLRIVNASITDVGCQCLRDLLRANTNIRRLMLARCPNMGVDGFGRLCDLLSVNSTLLALGVSDCEVDDDVAQRICDAADRHPSLTELDFSYNGRIVSAASAIAALFAHNYRLATINVEGTRCTENVKAAAHQRQQASEQPERLRVLLGDLIANHWELTSVQMRPTRMEDVRLDDTAIEMLAHALVDNTKVTHLDVSGNNMTLAGVKEIYRMLRLNRCTLRTLNVSDNRIDFGLQHAKLVAAVVGLHTVLESVDVSNTGMDDLGVEFIFGEIESFSNRIPVRDINVARNKLVSADVASRLRFMLRAHVLHPVVKRRFRVVHREWLLATYSTPFRSLKLGHVFASAADYFDVEPPSTHDRVACVEIAMDFLRAHAFSGVTAIDVAGNLCGDAGIKLVADYCCWAVERHRVPIETVNASENALTDEGVEHLCRAAAQCPTIRNIFVGGNSADRGGAVTAAAVTELQSRVAFNLQPEDMRKLLKAAEEGSASASAAANSRNDTGDIDESGRSQHHVNDTHVELLVRALGSKGAKEVRAVNLSNNHVTLTALLALARFAASGRQSLRKLALRNTLIRGTTADEAAPLCAALAAGRLTHVDLSDNEFTPAFADALLPTLRSSRTLTFFSMARCGLDAARELALASSVSLNALSPAAAAVASRRAAAAAVATEVTTEGAGSAPRARRAVTVIADDDPSSATATTTSSPSNPRRRKSVADLAPHAAAAVLDSPVLDLCRAALDERQLAEMVRMSMLADTTTAIDISCCKLLDDGLSQIVALLVGSASLEALNLASNTVCDRTIAALRLVVSEPTSKLRTLDMTHALSRRLRPGALLEFLDEAYEMSDSLWRVDVSMEHDAAHFTAGTQQQQQQQQPPLDDDKEENDDATSLAASSSAPSSCATDVVVIGPAERRAVERLRLNRQLELKRCLARLRSDDPSLTEVVATTHDESNIVDDVGMRYLSDALLANRHARSVALRITQVTEAGVRLLEPVLAAGSVVVSLALTGSQVLRDGRAFADLIKVSKGLSFLDVRDNRLVPPASLRELSAAIGLRRQMRHCDVTGCGSHEAEHAAAELAAARKAYSDNHVEFALRTGEVDLHRSTAADPELARLEARLKRAAVRAKQYRTELAAAAAAVERALFFNGHAVALSEFVEHESQEQVQCARRARQEERPRRAVAAASLRSGCGDRNDLQTPLDASLSRSMAATVAGAGGVLKLRSFTYRDDGEPIPGPYYSEPAAMAHLDLARPLSSLAAAAVAVGATHHGGNNSSNNISSAVVAIDGCSTGGDVSRVSAVAALAPAPCVSEDILMDDAAVKILCAALEENDTVVELSLAGQQLSAVSAIALGHMLRKNATLTRIDLRRNAMCDSVAALCDALAVNHTVRAVAIDDNGASAPLLRRLDVLCRVNAEPLSFKETLLAIFEHGVEPRTVDLSSGGASSGAESSPEEEERAAAAATTVVMLRDQYKWKKQRADDASAAMLCECGLRTCLSVRHLNVCGTDITDIGMAALLRALTETRTVASIHARGLALTDATGVLLAQAWGDIPTLSEVDLSGNAAITDRTLDRAIASACAAAKCTRFIVDECPAVSAGQRAKCATLCRVNVLFGKAADDRAALVECVMNDPTRTVVACNALVARGLMSPAALGAICTCVAMSDFVEELYLEHNDIGDDMLPVVVACVAGSSPSLDLLSLGGNCLVDVAPLCVALAPAMRESDVMERTDGGCGKQLLHPTNRNHDNNNKRAHVGAATWNGSSEGAAAQARRSVVGLVSDESSLSSPSAAATPLLPQTRLRRRVAAAAAAPALGTVVVDGGGDNNNSKHNAASSSATESPPTPTPAPRAPPRLTRLLLHKNRLSVASAFAIADMLRSSDQLAALDVSGQPWGRLGARVLVSSLLVNRGLRSFALAAEGVPAGMLAQAESALQQSHELRALGGSAKLLQSGHSF